MEEYMTYQEEMESVWLDADYQYEQWKEKQIQKYEEWMLEQELFELKNTLKKDIE